MSLPARLRAAGANPNPNLPKVKQLYVLFYLFYKFHKKINRNFLGYQERQTAN